MDSVRLNGSVSPPPPLTTTSGHHDDCPTPTIIVHGGAWKVPERLHARSLEGVKRAAIRGYRVLLARLHSNSRSADVATNDDNNIDTDTTYSSSPNTVTHSAHLDAFSVPGKPHNRSDALCLDAVEAAVRQLESDDVFDAGRGSCLTRDGGVEMDAAVMSTCRGLRRAKAGCVAAVSRVQHPVSAALAVARHGEHVLMVGRGCERFLETEAPSVKLLKNPDNYLVTADMRAEWQLYRTHYRDAIADLFSTENAPIQGHDTVGAVVLDGRGNIACATSTGGITGKRPGRVGDSPIIGSGLYCLSGTGAAVATGHGESILRAGLCKHVLDAVTFRQRYGVANRTNGRNGVAHGSVMHDAVADTLDFMAEVTEESGGGSGGGGVVALHANGEWTAQFSTPYMAWACVDRHGMLHAGMQPGEDVNCGHHSAFDYEFEDDDGVEDGSDQVL